MHTWHTPEMYGPTVCKNCGTMLKPHGENTTTFCPGAKS